MEPKRSKLFNMLNNPEDSNFALGYLFAGIEVAEINGDSSATKLLDDLRRHLVARQKLRKESKDAAI